MRKERWVSLPAIIISIVILLLASSAGLAHVNSVSANKNVAPKSGRQIDSSNTPFPLNSSSSSTVNPFYHYSGEPAPIGIADYGIGPNNSPYAYNTTSFLGKIDINSLKTANPVDTEYHSMSFQLNINLVFYENGREYVYWVQNIAEFDTLTHILYYLNDVWNTTNDAGNLSFSSIAGNGTVLNDNGHPFYADFANQSLPGSTVILNYPSEIELKMISYINSNNQPEVNFSYSDGYGWVTYDNVFFPLVTNMSQDLGFVVSGFHYEPYYHLFYNAELTMGGALSGANTSDVQSNLTLELQYWNGHNYQEIPNAYNFGSNTAESISNVTALATDQSTGGIPKMLITNGAGTLQQIYNSARISFLNVTVPISSGLLYVNNTSIPFVGGEANLSLHPGHYQIKVFSNNSLYREFSLNLTPGEYVIAKINGTSVTFSNYPDNKNQTSGINDYIIAGVAIASILVVASIIFIGIKRRK